MILRSLVQHERAKPARRKHGAPPDRPDTTAFARTIPPKSKSAKSLPETNHGRQESPMRNAVTKSLLKR